MKYVFFGSPEFAAIILEKLVKARYMPEAVVCSPDEPTGRNKVLTPPVVKQLITNNKWQVEILQPKTSKDLSAIIPKISAIQADVFIVAAYAKIIPKEILNLPKFKTIGAHPSLLPKYRGASPIQTAILNGEKETGATIFLVDEKVDHGPILANSKWPIANDTNYIELSKELANLSGDLLIKTLPKYLNGGNPPVGGPKEQNHSEATFTKKFSTEDGCVDLEKDSPELIFNKIRALNPDPGVFTFIKTKAGKKRVRLLEANLINDNLELLKVQPEGKKPMSFKDFQNGNL